MIFLLKCQHVSLQAVKGDFSNCLNTGPEWAAHFKIHILPTFRYFCKFLKSNKMTYLEFPVVG